MGVCAHARARASLSEPGYGERLKIVWRKPHGFESRSSHFFYIFFLVHYKTTADVRGTCNTRTQTRARVNGRH